MPGSHGGTAGWEPRTPDSRAAGGEILPQPVPSQHQLASSCGGCLESPKALPSPSSPRFTAGERGEGWGWWWAQRSPGDVHQQPWQAPPAACRCTCAMQMSAPAPYLNISVTSPLASATRTGKPMQAGTRYRRAGWKKTQGGEAVLGRALAQGYAHPSTPFLGMTGAVAAQVHRAS